MLRKKQIEELYELFQANNENPDIHKLEEIALTKDKNEVLKVLFLYANNILENYNGTILLEKTLQCINNVIEESISINRKRVKRSLTKLDEKITEKEFTLLKNEDITQIENLKRCKKKIEKIEEDTIKNETRNFKMLEYIINESKNLSYLEKTFDFFPNFVNLEDKNGHSIFIGVLNKYIESLENITEDDSLSRYYRQVLNLIQKQENFILNSTDKNLFFQNIDCSIGKTKKMGNRYVKNRKILKELRNSLVEEKDKIDFDMNKIATKYNISNFFESDIIKEINSYKMPISINEYRDREVINEYIISIDSPNTSIIDDAISIKKLENNNYLLGVHVVDVRSYLKKESILESEALSRVKNIYLPNDVIPIFPLVFSQDIASLNEDEYHLAKSFFFEINDRGYIEKRNFVKSIVMNNKSCDFDQINRIMHEGSQNKKLEKTVCLLEKVGKLLKKTLKKPEKIYLAVKNNDEEEFSNDKHLKSQKILNRIMQLVNSEVANYFSINNYPCLYLVHNVDKESLRELEVKIKQLSTIENKEKFDKLYKALLETYPREYYDISGSHDGLKISHYCHSTSPLRRSADLIIEKGLDLCYFNHGSDKEIQQYEKQIKEIKDIINAKESDIKYFIDDYSKQYKVYKYKSRQKR